MATAVAASAAGAGEAAGAAGLVAAEAGDVAGVADAADRGCRWRSCRAPDSRRVMLEAPREPRGSGSRRVARLLPPPARAFRCSTSRGPVSFCPAQPGVRKCNRAARCDAHPISDRCRKRHNRRELAGCGNRRSHWRRKFAGRGQPCPTSARDKGHCRLRPLADRDARSGNSGMRTSPAHEKANVPKIPRKSGTIPFIGRPSRVSSSCGLRNVGNVAVRPRPKSIRPK